jgi:hypothetical protein
MNQLVAHSDMDRAVPYESRHEIAAKHPSLPVGARMTLWAVVCTWALACSIAGHAQSVYRDPAGNFTVQVPKGWQTQPQDDNHGISVVEERYQASVTVGVMRNPGGGTPSAENELAQLQGQLGQQCPNAHIRQRGSASIAGLSGVFLIVSCTENGAEEVMKFATASGPGTMIVLNTAAPSSSLGSVESLMTSIERSITVPGGNTNSWVQTSGANNSTMDSSRNARQIAVLKKACSNGVLSKEECDQKMAALTKQPETASANTDQSTVIESNDPNPPPNMNVRTNSKGYRDEQGRYSLAVPEGWTARPETDGSGTLQLSRGQAWATVTLMTGTGEGSSRPVEIAHAILQDLQSDYQQPQLLDEGDFRSNGHEAHGANATGIDKRGRRVSVTVVSVQARGLDFLSVVSSAPNDQAEEINGQVMQMVKSIRFGGE